MRLAVLTTNLVHTTGEGRILESLLKGLLERGYAVDLFTTHLESDLAARPGLTLHRIKTWRGGVTAMVVQFGLLAPLYFWRASRHTRYDLVVGNSLNVYVRQDLNICNFCHNAWQKLPESVERRAGWRGLVSGFLRWYWAWAERRLFPRLARQVLADSQLTKAGLENEAAFPAGQVEVMTNGVDLAEFSPVESASRREELQRELGLPVDPAKIYLVFVGDLSSPRKGLQNLLRAVHNLSDPRLHLIVAGNRAGNIFEAQVERLGLTGAVSFVGHQARVAEVYRAGDLLVFPTLFEPWGLVVGEAMACGLPVITTGQCGAAEMITPGQDGLIVADPHDLTALQEAIRDLTADPARLKEWGRQARLKSLEYSWERVVDRLEKHLHEALTARRRGGR